MANAGLRRALSHCDTRTARRPILMIRNRIRTEFERECDLSRSTKHSESLVEASWLHRRQPTTRHSAIAASIRYWKLTLISCLHSSTHLPSTFSLFFLSTPAPAARKSRRWPLSERAQWCVGGRAMRCRGKCMIRRGRAGRGQIPGPGLPRPSVPALGWVGRPAGLRSGETYFQLCSA